MEAGKAPERSTSARSSACSEVKLPVMRAESVVMASLMLGADRTSSSSTMASWLPTFFSVVLLNNRTPSLLRKNTTSARPLKSSWERRAFLRCCPVTEGAFRTAR